MNTNHVAALIHFKEDERAPGTFTGAVSIRYNGADRTIMKDGSLGLHTEAYSCHNAASVDEIVQKLALAAAAAINRSGVFDPEKKT